LKLHSLNLAPFALFLALVTACGSAGCDRKRPHPVPTANAVSNTARTTDSYADEWPTDQLIGHWSGPEGTFLRIGGERGRYLLTIKDLDGQHQYSGRAVDGQIQFERDGVTETLRPTKGEETGMKWLSDKTNCITVHKGEGYCKD
jgi:hypothetical protein